MATVALPNYAAVTEYLFGLRNRGTKFGIERMQLLSEALGHPERRFPVIHIAGTNGKGSVAAMLEAIFREAGYRTGLFTSPHLVKLGERVQVNRRPLSEDEIVGLVGALRTTAERLGTIDPADHPTFFEFTTAMAFLQFARERVDIGIVETGLGGRLDATNIVRPEIAVITSIGLDHCEILGNTLEQIAAEKAGIIKPATPVVLGRMPPEAEAVIRGIAAAREAPVHAVDAVFGDRLEPYPTTNLESEYQRWNAATATLACRVLQSRWRLPPEAVRRALQTVSWPGRWQRLELAGRRLVLDATHNPEGAAVLEPNLQRLAAEGGRAPIVVLGVLGEERARALLPVVSRYAREIHFVAPRQERACSHEELERLLPSDFRGPVHRSTLEQLFPAPGACSVGESGDTILVTGSIYLIGEVFERMGAGGLGEGRLQDW